MKAVEQLERVIAGHLAFWQGLSGSETVETVMPALQPVIRVEGPIREERTTYLCEVTRFRRSRAPVQIEAWVLLGQPSVTLLEYDNPIVHDLEGTLRALGKPALVAESKNKFAKGAVVMEYVFAGRGLSLSIAEPANAIESKQRSAVHVQLFRAESAEYYIQYIGAGPELRPFPRER